MAGHGAEAATPGVQSQFLGKSGSNKFAGELYQDFYNNSFQTSNLSDGQLATGLRPGSNEVQRYYDTNVSFGGPIKKDRIWFHTSWRRQFNAIEQPLFNFDSDFETWNTNPSIKTTYQINQRNKLIGYLPVEHEGTAESAAVWHLCLRQRRPDVAPGVAELGVEG